MTKNEFLYLVDEIVEVPMGTLTGSELLVDVPSWDSLATIVFQAEMDERFGIEIEPVQIARCKTFNDLIGLLDDKIAA